MFSKFDVTTPLTAGGFVSGTHLSGETPIQKQASLVAMGTPSTFNQVSVVGCHVFFFWWQPDTTSLLGKGFSFFAQPQPSLFSFRVPGLHQDDRGGQGKTLEHHSIPSRRIGQYLSKNASKKNCWELTATSNKAACRGMYLVCTWVNALILCYISKNGSRFKGLETETWQKQSQCSHLLEGPLECLCQDCYSLGESPHRRGVRKGSKASAAYGGESSMVPPCPTPPILCWR